jgi:hypothetical protein
LTADERYELELETIINPFAPPKPWVRKTRLDGEVVYVNTETKQVKTVAPGQVNEGTKSFIDVSISYSIILYKFFFCLFFIFIFLLMCRSGPTSSPT